VKEKSPDLRQESAEETAPIEEEDVPSMLWTRVTMIQVKIGTALIFLHTKSSMQKNARGHKYFRVTLSI
jgi:hypothetical protein